MFRFKQFSVKQEKTAMKVSSDAVLFGACIDFSEAGKILDIGTGTGLLALMAAQKNSVAKITAVEIDNDAADEAKENVQNSKWQNRITVVNEDFTEFAEKCSTKFDIIISNPPFFKNHLLPENKKRKIARHTQTLKFDDLLEYSAKLLSKNGRFFVMLPYEEADDFIKNALKFRLFCNKKVIVKPSADKSPNRIFLKFSFSGKTEKENIITIRNNNKYTDEYLKITADFYLFANPK